MPESIDGVVDLLDLETIDANLFRGAQPKVSGLKRVFGGQVAAQAIMAAMRTVPDDRHVHSLHVYFLLGGDPALPIVYDVERVRDGGSFTMRRVAARQHGETIFFMTVSFQRSEDGFEHQDLIPDVPGPEENTALMDIVSGLAPQQAELWKREWGGFDLRFVGDNRDKDDPDRQKRPAVQRLWFRAGDALSDDPRIHEALFTYISDFTLLGAALAPHGVLISSPTVQPASLDHAVWFHRPFRVDEWLLYDQTSPSAHGARGLSTANVFDQQGRLVASVAQEGLIRPVNREA